MGFWDRLKKLPEFTRKGLNKKSEFKLRSFKNIEGQVRETEVSEQVPRVRTRNKEERQLKGQKLS